MAADATLKTPDGELAYIGLGANLGDAAATVARAVDALHRVPGSHLVAVSSLWRSAPVQAAGPDFFNAVAAVRTLLSPLALLDELQRLETAFGRERPFHHAPRTLDLDLLLMGTRTYRDARLVLPHPRLHERAFVLFPLLEVAPGAHIPGHGAAAGLLCGVAGQRCERQGPVPRV